MVGLKCDIKRRHQAPASGWNIKYLFFLTNENIRHRQTCTVFKGCQNRCFVLNQFIHMNLSKYSPSFGGYSVAQIWASQFEFDDTPNQGTTKTSWCQHSDCALVACYFCVKKRLKNGFLWQQGNCIIHLQKTNGLIICDVMVVCQCVQKCLGNPLYNNIVHKKKLGSSFVYHRGFCSFFF